MSQLLRLRLPNPSLIKKSFRKDALSKCVTVYISNRKKQIVVGAESCKTSHLAQRSVHCYCVLFVP